MSIKAEGPGRDDAGRVRPLLRRRDHAVPIRVHLREHRGGDRHAGGQAQAQDDAVLADGDRRGLQVLVQPMRRGRARQAQPQGDREAEKRFHGRV